MSNLRCIFDNVFDAATLTTFNATTVATMPVEHLQTYSHSERFVTTSSSNVTIRASYQYPVLISGLRLERHNLGPMDTIQVVGYNADDAVVFDTGAVTAVKPYPLGSFRWGIEPIGRTPYSDWDWASTDIWLDSEYGVTYYDIIVNSPRLKDGYLEIDRIYAGVALSANWNFVWGYALGTTNRKKDRVYGRQRSIFASSEQLSRSLKFSLNDLSDAERETWFTAVFAAGLHKDIVVSLFPSDGRQKERDHSMVCKLKNLPDQRGLHNDFNAMILELEEA